MTQDRATTTTLLSQLKNILESWRQRAQAISTDPNVLHWQKVNIESFTSVIEDLGLSSTSLRRARDSYPGVVQDVLQLVSVLANELYNLESDIKLGPVTPEIAQAAALKIEDQCKELKPDFDQLLGYHKTLAGGSKTLKENLNFHSFLPQARLQASGKTKSLFETGYTIYLTVSDTPDIGHDENITNMFRFLSKATKLQETIGKTEIPTLPAMSRSFVEQQLKLCLAACEQVRLFINFVSDYFQSEMDYIKSFQTNLARLKAQPLTELLFEIQNQTDAASKCVQAFTHKKFLLDDIQKANHLLSSVATFHHLLATNFIPYLEIQVDKKNGLLNPQTLATVRARKYFTGLKGLWRFTRMLLLSVNANSLISPEDIEKKISDAINTCSFYFKHDAQDSIEINTFIGIFFTAYKRPFPHDELADLIKKCIVTYATILDRVFLKYQTKQEESEDDEQHNVIALGRLAGNIELQTETLQKYRQKFEN